MNFLQWFEANYLIILAVFFAFYIIGFHKFPSITAWQAFLDSFESKGGQLLLLWVSDGLVLLLLIHFWKMFDAQLQTTIVGILSAVNGAFLGAIGAKATSNGNGAAPSTPESIPANGKNQPTLVPPASTAPVTTPPPSGANHP
jgi:hypothetical protein